ncbi:hypothetical protein PSACC_03144 [Paramicrosporidium saccamoebae]|uniref:Uncharacterized protein n=1 Tax=Paramicrosporidium saccamoebae TaxID=1246581 RepID=A0A2H9TH55_9FUNG|nr:hypothetical protein PSACC_03144 [Paramicrosporidium saccamoebae]
MGINGLLPLLRSITRRVHLEQLAGQAVAIDAYSWLHKGVFVEFCMNKVRLLLYYNVRPILVFDGAHLPMKSHQELLRSKTRKDSRLKAHQLIDAGDASAAYIHIQKSVDVTPRMAARLIEELKRTGIDYVVAPYEADAQMAYLSLMGTVSAVITEDSDLLLFGCKRVLFKLDKDGNTDEICIDRLSDATELDLSMFSYQKVRSFALPNMVVSSHVHAVGVRLLAINTRDGFEDCLQISVKVLQVLRAEMPTKMPVDYESEFAKAEMTFLHQRVYDGEKRRICFLNPLPLQAEDFHGDQWSFLGPPVADTHAQGICEGELCPNTLEPFRRLPPVRADPVPEVIFESPTPPEAVVLPFEIHLDKGKNSTLNLRTDAINAARVSLKRSFSTSLGQENCPPLQVKARSFAYSTEKLALPYTAYSKSKKHGKASSQPLDSGQKSIRDFLKFSNNN